MIQIGHRHDRSMLVDRLICSKCCCRSGWVIAVRSVTVALSVEAPRCRSESRDRPEKSCQSAAALRCLPVPGSVSQARL